MEMADVTIRIGGRSGPTALLSLRRAPLGRRDEGPRRLSQRSISRTRRMAEGSMTTGRRVAVSRLTAQQRRKHSGAGSERRAAQRRAPIPAATGEASTLTVRRQH